MIRLDGIWGALVFKLEGASGSWGVESKLDFACSEKVLAVRGVSVQSHVP